MLYNWTRGDTCKPSVSHWYQLSQTNKQTSNYCDSPIDFWGLRNVLYFPFQGCNITVLYMSFHYSYGFKCGIPLKEYKILKGLDLNNLTRREMNLKNVVHILILDQVWQVNTLVTSYWQISGSNEKWLHPLCLSLGKETICSKCYFGPCWLSFKTLLNPCKILLLLKKILFLMTNQQVTFVIFRSNLLDLRNASPY